MEKKFFKYTDFIGASKILYNSSLRFSSPLVFNDPFDMSLETLFKYDPYDSSNEINDEFNQYLDEGSDIEVSGNNGLNKIAKICQEAFQVMTDEQKTKLRKKMKEKRPVYDKNSLKESIEYFHSNLKNSLALDGIFCASLTHDNILMWSHYADQHKGAVLEFTPNVKEDSIFNTFKKVKYSNKRPILYESPRDFIMQSLGTLPEERLGRYIKEITFTKSEDWAYEKEVRISVAEYIKGEKQYENTEFDPTMLTAIYLGSRMGVEETELFSSLITPKYQHVKIFKAHQSQTEYKIEMKPCDINLFTC